MMLRYRKTKNQESRRAHVLGIDGLLNSLANVTLEKGRGQNVIVPDWLSNALDGGKVEAMTHLAGLHLVAHRNIDRMKQAESLLREASEKGYAPAQEQLGIICLFGLGRNADPEAAESWLRLAADQGRGVAQSLLGMMLATGAGVERDLPQAMQLLALAEQQGDGFASKCLKNGKDLGMVPQFAAFSLGMLHVLGTVMSNCNDDDADAEFLHGITMLAEAGDADACFVLAMLKQQEGNGAEAQHWFLGAAAVGHELAVLIAGLLAFVDQGDIRDAYPVTDWLEVATQDGSAHAQALLGLMHTTGRGVDRDVSKGNRLLDLAAEAVDTSSALGEFVRTLEKRSYLEMLMHVLGKVIAAQMSSGSFAGSDGGFDAVEEATQLAKQGDHFAQVFVGLSLWAGQDVAEDKLGAIKWMQDAARQGHMEAQYFLGVCFDTGDGVERDRKEALGWFRLAAEQGHEDSQFALAHNSLLRDGTEKDQAEALHWLRMSAEQGNATSQFHLGLALLNDIDTDPEDGFSWLFKAAHSGSQNAKAFLDRTKRD
ncbi:Hypothetical protein RAK1035_0394 [Roseovarius sp. AK1035]|uniref:tetratricopeptide repeat protein n=1 Tax=Roseovarius sp. TM1035 TaxID=391613 RepID=UPI0003197AC3|nr:tetratricopeptide repeat protein [Roseovarius sp. TM1035]AWZ19105.1 Hypothetical protein RAK1035_0394 [Roseovarius sp. AK1035]